MRIPAVSGAIAMFFCLAAGASDAVPAFSAEQSWKQVFEKGDIEAVQASYVVLGKLVDESGNLDAKKCLAAKGELEKALGDNPVSLALQAAASNCSHALDDEDAADRHSRIFAQLVRDAMSEQPGNFGETAVRVMAEQDIEAFVLASGEEIAHVYYALSDNGSSLKMHVALWNSESNRERWLAFDFIGPEVELQHANPYAGFPVFRFQLARSTIQTFSKTDASIAGEMSAFYTAMARPEGTQREEAVDGLAAHGNAIAIHHVVYACLIRHEASCESRAIDLLLPLAETHSARAMLMLAALQVDPVAARPDEKSAKALLDAADLRLRSFDASAQFAVLMNERSKDGKLRPFVRKRLQMAAEAGNPNAEWLMAVREIAYEKRGTLRRKTLAGLKHAAETGLSGPEELLARQLWNSGSKEDALKWFEQAANHGDVDAQRWLARRFENGSNTTPDLAKARYWHAMAANRGSVESMMWLAHSYRSEPETAQSRHQQNGWLRSATVFGDIDAAIELAYLFSSTASAPDFAPASAETLYRAVLEKHDRADARRGLASLLLGVEGVGKNTDEARKLLTQDAEKGDPLSQTELGIGLVNGDFGEIDSGGRDWLRKASDAGNARAASSLGIALYYDVDGGGRDPAAAISYMTKAAEESDSEAQNNLAWALCTTEDVSLRDAQRGKEVIGYLLGESKENPLAWIDTDAACRAATGDFAEAVRLEEQVVEAARKKDPSNATSIARFEARVAMFRKGQPFIEHPDKD